jgi:hypothetical protein
VLLHELNDIHRVVLRFSDVVRFVEDTGDHLSLRFLFSCESFTNPMDASLPTLDLSQLLCEVLLARSSIS